MLFGVWPDWLEWLLIGKKTFVSAILNGVTLAGLYFLVASGFTLVFGLMRNVNLAHGSLFLLGAYIGYDIAHWTGQLVCRRRRGRARHCAGRRLAADLRLSKADRRRTAPDPGDDRHLDRCRRSDARDLGRQDLPVHDPRLLDGAVATPIITAIKSNGQIVTLRYPLYRLVVLAASIVIGVGLWLTLNKTRFGVMIRAGVDDRAMLSVAGVNVRLCSSPSLQSAGLLAGLSGVIGGSALSIAPGEDVRYLLVSLVVVIVGGMGSITGAAIGALLIGLAEQIGLVYFPTYGVVLTFVIMVVTLALRPQGIMGNARTRLCRSAAPPFPAISFRPSSRR